MPTPLASKLGFPMKTSSAPRLITATASNTAAASPPAFGAEPMLSTPLVAVAVHTKFATIYGDAPPTGWMPVGASNVCPASETFTFGKSPQQSRAFIHTCTQYRCPTTKPVRFCVSAPGPWIKATRVPSGIAPLLANGVPAPMSVPLIPPPVQPVMKFGFPPPR